jgi:hypothetical protein
MQRLRAYFRKISEIDVYIILLAVQVLLVSMLLIWLLGV